MGNHMSAADWDMLLPRWPVVQDRDYSVGALGRTRFAPLVAAVFLDTRWPGLAPAPDDLPVWERFGRWAVTDDSLVCIGRAYEIEGSRLNEVDWYDHLCEKTWFYDPSDFLDAFAAARARFVPEETEVQRAEALARQVAVAQERAPFELVIPPTSQTGRAVYRVSHLTADERAAFCAFLAAEGFYATY